MKAAGDARPSPGGSAPQGRLVESRCPCQEAQTCRAGWSTPVARYRKLSPAVQLVEPTGPVHGGSDRPGLLVEPRVQERPRSASVERRPIGRHGLPRSAAPERPGANHLRRSPTTDRGRRSVCPSVTAGARACWSTRAGGHTTLVVLQVQPRAPRPGTDTPAPPARSRKHGRPAGSPARTTWPNRVPRGSGRNERYTNGRQVAPDNRRARQRHGAASPGGQGDPPPCRRADPVPAHHVRLGAPGLHGATAASVGGLGKRTLGSRATVAGCLARDRISPESPAGRRDSTTPSFHPHDRLHPNTLQAAAAAAAAAAAYRTQPPRRREGAESAAAMARDPSPSLGARWDPGTLRA